MSAHAPQSPLREGIEYAGYRAGISLLRRLPDGVAYGMGSAAARGAYALGMRRAVTLANLRIAFPDLPEARRRGIALQSYRHLAWNAVDALRALHCSEAELAQRFEILGREHYDAAHARGHGVLVLVPHLGSFELALVALALVGVRIAVVARPFSNRRVSEDFEALRTRTGAELLPHRGAAPRILETLREGRAVVVVNDQYTRRGRGIFSPFLGVRACTSPGPATLSLRSGAPVVPLYTVRLSRNRHRAICLPPIAPQPTAERAVDIQSATDSFNEVLTNIIRQHPEQWMWGHRRFRHSPDLSESPYSPRSPFWRPEVDSS